MISGGSGIYWVSWLYVVLASFAAAVFVWPGFVVVTAYMLVPPVRRVLGI